MSNRLSRLAINLEITAQKKNSSNNFEFFNYLEKEDIVKEGFFEKLFNSDSNSSKLTKFSWDLKSTKISSENTFFYHRLHPLNALEKIGNMDTFFYILENMLSFTMEVLHPIRFCIIKSTFDLMISLNKSHGLALKRTKSFLREFTALKLIDKL